MHVIACLTNFKVKFAEDEANFVLSLKAEPSIFLSKVKKALIYFKVLQSRCRLSHSLKETVFQKEYLSVLDVITDKLIDPSATEFDHTISELWYYISKS